MQNIYSKNLAAAILQKEVYKMKYLFLSLISIALLGCSESNQNVIPKHFEKPVIVTDEAGNKFTIKHHMGNVYLVEPLLKVEKLENRAND